MLRVKIFTLSCLAKNWNALVPIIYILGFADKPWESRGVEKKGSKELEIIIGVNVLGWIAVSGIFWIVI